MDATPEWLREEPFVWAVASAYLNKRCTFCMLKKTDERALFRCTRCNFIHYCSVECQRADWGQHRAECRRLQNVAVQRRKNELPSSLDETYPDDMVSPPSLHVPYAY